MAIQRNNFEGGTAGSAVGTSAAGGNAFTASDSTMAFSNTFVAHGSLGAQYTGTATGSGAVRYALDGQTVSKEVVYVQTTGAQTADLDLIRLSITGDSTAVTARINGVNRLRLALPGSVFPWTATADFPLNTFVRLELWADSVAGSARLAAYLGDSTTPLTGMDSGILTGINVGNSAVYINGRAGKLNGNALVGNVGFDDPATYTGTDATSSPSPFVATPPTVSAGANATLATTGGTATLSGTASASGGATISSATWTVTEKPLAAGSVTIQNPSVLSGSANAALTTPGRYTFTVTVTDSNGQTASATTRRFVPATGVGSVSVLEVTSSGAWSGSVSALNDADDTTYMESPSATGSQVVLRLNPLATPTTFEIDPSGLLSQAGTGSLRFELLQGSTVRKDWGTIALTTTVSTSSLTMQSSEINTVTDWTELDLRVTWTTP